MSSKDGVKIQEGFLVQNRYAAAVIRLLSIKSCMCAQPESRAGWYLHSLIYSRSWSSAYVITMSMWSSHVCTSSFAKILSVMHMPPPVTQGSPPPKLYHCTLWEISCWRWRCQLRMWTVIGDKMFYKRILIIYIIIHCIPFYKTLLKSGGFANCFRHSFYPAQLKSTAREDTQHIIHTIILELIDEGTLFRSIIGTCLAPAFPYLQAGFGYPQKNTQMSVKNEKWQRVAIKGGCFKCLCCSLWVSRCRYIGKCCSDSIEDRGDVSPGCRRCCSS